MKRLLPALCVALLVTTLGPASAEARWWHHHSGPGPAGVGANDKLKRTRAPREKHQRSKAEALYHFPKSVGIWRHDVPGPAGAGGEQGVNQAPKQQSARHSSSHRSLFLWRHHDNNSAASTTSGK